MKPRPELYTAGIQERLTYKEALGDKNKKKREEMVPAKSGKSNIIDFAFIRT